MKQSEENGSWFLVFDLPSVIFRDCCSEIRESKEDATISRIHTQVRKVRGVGGRDCLDWEI